jgi:hypothetical protein
MTTVNIDHPHAEVIAAYYSGKTIQWCMKVGWRDWARGQHIGNPAFLPEQTYRIKPEPLVRWAVICDNEVIWGLYGCKEAALGATGCRGTAKTRVVRMVETPE